MSLPVASANTAMLFVVDDAGPTTSPVTLLAVASRRIHAETGRMPRAVLVATDVSQYISTAKARLPVQSTVMLVVTMVAAVGDEPKSPIPTGVDAPLLMFCPC